MYSEEWKEFIDGELTKPYMAELKSFIDYQRSKGNVYPPKELTFNAFVQCEWWDLKIIILGVEPYHGSGQADGMAYSSPLGPSKVLTNILKEVYNDCFNSNSQGMNVSQTSDLSQWAWQGVLLLNALLTINENTPGSHKGKGWEIFTTEAIRFINKHPHKLVFMLWGPEAQSYKKLINTDKHLVLECAHPSETTKWFGNKHFSQADAWIKKHYFNVKPQMNWALFSRPPHIMRTNPNNEFNAYIGIDKKPHLL